MRASRLLPNFKDGQRRGWAAPVSGGTTKTNTKFIAHAAIAMGGSLTRRRIPCAVRRWMYNPQKKRNPEILLNFRVNGGYGGPACLPRRNSVGRGIEQRLCTFGGHSVKARQRDFGLSGYRPLHEVHRVAYGRGAAQGIRNSWRRVVGKRLTGGAQIRLAG